MIVRETVDLADLKVLFFHEAPKQLKHYLSILRFCGLRGIDVAERLSEAIKRIISEKYDMIIVTHHGEAQGLSRLLEELNGLDATASIPVVAILADGSVKNALCVLAKGVDEILVEPLSQQAVENVVQKILRDYLQNDKIREKIESARQLLSGGEFEQAEKAYRGLLFHDSHNIEAYLGLFEINMAKEEWAKAEANIKKALELAKSSKDKIQAHRELSRVFFHYGSMYERRHQLEKAIKSYRTSLSLNPYDIQSVKALLHLLQKRDEVDEIITVLKETQASFFPYSHALEEIVVCLTELAQTFMDLNMPVQARRMYEQLVGIHHGNGAVHLKVADYFLGLGQVTLVLKTLIDVSRRIKDPDLLCKIGDILLDTEKRYMSAGKVDGPPSVDLSFFQGLDKMKVVQMALKLFQQGILLDPASPVLRMSIACCYLRMGDLDSASEILDRLKENCKDDVEILASAIELMIDERAFGIAGAWLKEMIAGFPKETRFYLLNARYYRGMEQPYEAIACLKKGLVIHHDQPEFIAALARLYQDLKQYSDAISYFERAGKLSSADPSIQEGLKEVLAAKYGRGKG